MSISNSVRLNFSCVTQKEHECVKSTQISDIMDQKNEMFRIDSAQEHLRCEQICRCQSFSKHNILQCTTLRFM